MQINNMIYLYVPDYSFFCNDAKEIFLTNQVLPWFGFFKLRRSLMNRWLILTAILFLSVYLIAGCSRRTANPVASDTTAGTDEIQFQAITTGNHYLLGYYDVYFDMESETFDANLNRSASFTLNIVPFLNQMTIPQNGITFDSIVIHNDDPSFLGVDVEFSVYHPFPGYAQYQAYDMLGVVIGNGSGTLEYNGLRYPVHGTDLWMKNSDGYTRWFNPTDFTTEMIFGWAPGGYQNLEGTSQVNPYKYYAKNLQKDDNLWSFLTGDNNFDGLFESGIGRTMELEFPMPDPGLTFGYAVVVAWEDEGPTGPYHPYHHNEAVAALVSQTPNAWFDPDTLDFGGDLILDIDLFGWKEQPSTVKIESAVLNDIASFDFETCASPGGENYSTWHVEVPVDSISELDGNEAWVITEYEGFGYKNGLPDIPSPDDPLAAFFRIDLDILDGEPQPDELFCDVIVDTLNSPEMPYVGWQAEFAFDASGSYDPTGVGITSYEWDFDNDDVFGDPYDSGDDIHPVKVFTFTNQEQVSLRISNGDLSSECYVEVDIVAYPTKNIDISNGDYLARDIAFDPSNGDVLVYYEGNDSTWLTDVRRYYLSDYFTNYETCSIFWASEEDLGVLNPEKDYTEVGDYIDVNADGDFVIGVHRRYQNPPPSPLTYIHQVWSYYYTASGVEISSHNWHSTWFSAWQPHVFDAHAFSPTSAGRENDLGITWEFGSGGVRYNRHTTYQDPLYNTPWPNEIEGEEYRTSTFYGYRTWGTETDRDTDYIWLVMKENTVAWLWDLQTSISDGWAEVGPRFGVFSPADNEHQTQPYSNAIEDETGLFCAQDITRDMNNQYYVLDRLEIEEPFTYIIKSFTYTQSPPETTPHGMFGSGEDWMYEPIRIDGSDYNENLVVLHVDSDGTTSMLSVFLADETPD